MHVHRNTPAPARWRVACVDGILHVAYMAAVAAESAAHRCADRVAHAQPSSRRLGRHRLGRLHPRARRAARRPIGARAGHRSRRRHAR